MTAFGPNMTLSTESTTWCKILTHGPVHSHGFTKMSAKSEEGSCGLNMSSQQLTVDNIYKPRWWKSAWSAEGRTLLVHSYSSASSYAAPLPLPACFLISSPSCLLLLLDAHPPPFPLSAPPTPSSKLAPLTGTSNGYVLTFSTNLRLI